MENPGCFKTVTGTIVRLAMADRLRNLPDHAMRVVILARGYAAGRPDIGGRGSEHL
jgi:hypothetical protein